MALSAAPFSLKLCCELILLMQLSILLLRKMLLLVVNVLMFSMFAIVATDGRVDQSVTRVLTQLG